MRLHAGYCGANLVPVTIFGFPTGDGGFLSFPFSFLALQSPNVAHCKYIEPMVCHVY